MYYRNRIFSTHTHTQKPKRQKTLPNKENKIKGVLCLCLAAYSKLQEERDKLMMALLSKKEPSSGN